MLRAVISFPKSGRTWLRVMLDDLGIALEYSHANAGHKRPVPFQKLDTRLADEYDLIVFLHRDPRDTAVSGYYQKSKRRDGYGGTISNFLRDPLHGVEKIVRYNRMWLDLAARSPKIMAVSYEELHADPLATLRQIIRFLGEERADSLIAEAIERNTFEKMKLREQSGYYSSKYGDILSPANPDDPDSFKVRRGKIGGYRDELNPVDVTFCDEVVARLASKSIRSTPAPLPVCERVFARLDEVGIRYCHWKSNIRLDRSLAGYTDLDVLVQDEHWDAFIDIIRQHGFVPMLNPPEKTIDGMADYLGFDEMTGGLAHIHLHRKLVLGTRTIKDVHLPIEHLFWPRLTKQFGVAIPTPALELYVLLIRAMLKLKPDAKQDDPIAWLPRNIVDEITDLHGRVNRDGLLDIARKADLPVDASDFVALADAVTSGTMSSDQMLRIHRSISVALKPYALRHGSAPAPLWFSRLSNLFDRISPKMRSKKRLSDAGRCFALIGADGSGKSTLVKELSGWFEWKLRCQRMYLGLPKQSRPYRWLQKVEQFARKRRKKKSGWRQGLWDSLGSGCRALRFYHAAQHRFRQIRRIDRLMRQGVIILCDRFPLAELHAHDFSMDGPRIALECGNRLRWLAAREHRIYRKMPRPDVAIVLRTDPEVLRQRKQDLPCDVQVRKAELVNAIPPSERVIVVDNNRKYPEVVLDLKRRLWSVLTDQPTGGANEPVRRLNQPAPTETVSALTSEL